MALRFNPPPNWPAPPEGFEPPAGWQPDPAWGPAPEGWQIWVDDSATSSGSAASAAGAGGESDPAWAPTQAVSTAPTAQMGTNASVAGQHGLRPVPHAVPGSGSSWWPAASGGGLAARWRRWARCSWRRIQADHSAVVVLGERGGGRRCAGYLWCRVGHERLR